MLFQDIRYAVRSLLKDRAVTAIVVACLALGIGINATLFSVVDGVLLQPLPFFEPHRLVLINETFQRGGIREAGVSYQDLRDWKSAATSFSSIVGITGRSLALSDGGEPERLLGAAVSWDLFPTLGVPPALGRHFGPEDDRSGAEPVVILSDEIWQRRYLGDPGILGRSVSVNGRPHTVVAVMPVGFAFPEIHRAWIPLTPVVEKDPRSSRGLMTIGKLKPGVELSQAQTELAAVAAKLGTEYPSTNEGWSVLVRPLAEEFTDDDVRLVIWTMMGAVTLVLMIACANVANLMLARSSKRHREFSVRAALGAGRGRMVRQLLTECVMLGLFAAPIGVAIAYLGTWMLDSAVPPDDIPYYINWDVSPRVIAYTVAVSALTGIIFGLAPALQAGRLNLVEALRDGARGSGQSGRRARVRNGLVIAEVALALVLLVGASLFIRSFFNLQGASAGFDTSPLLTLRFYLTGDTYAANDPKIQRVADIVRRVEGLPGVQAAFASNFVPIDGGGGGGAAIVDGRPLPRGEEPEIGFTGVTSHLFKTIGVSLIKGRDFTDAEGMSRTPVAVINEAMAKKLWPDTDAVDRRFRLAQMQPEEWFTVIGVAPNIQQSDMDDDTPPDPVAYVPFPYGPSANTGLTIRVAANPASLTAAVREQIRASDPGIPLFAIRTMEEVRTSSFLQYRLFGQMFGIFGATALFLAAIGVYGVLSFSVSQRTQEMGVRIALGAARRDVLRLVVRQGVLLCAIGIVVGLAGAFGITRVIRTLLYNVTPTDPISFGGVALFLTAIAFLASYLPARRATTVDPIVALRNE
ncbi:MAG: ABC transporter permease [Vicinamibacterales bacterium]